MSLYEWRAIIRSSSVGITHTETALLLVLMTSPGKMADSAKIRATMGVPPLVSDL